MRAIMSKKINIVLELSEEEAKWLKGMVQNYLVPGKLIDESEDNTKMRMSFWNALEDKI